MTPDWLRFKWGVAKLIAECKIPPIIVPIWHEGFEEILPNFPPYIPKCGKDVTVLVGDPIDAETVMKIIENGGKNVENGRQIESGSDVDFRAATSADGLFKPEEEQKIKSMYGWTELSSGDVTRKRICDYLETEMKTLKRRARGLHNLAYTDRGTDTHTRRIGRI